MEAYLYFLGRDGPDVGNTFLGNGHALETMPVQSVNRPMEQGLVFAFHPDFFLSVG